MRTEFNCDCYLFLAIEEHTNFCKAAQKKLIVREDQRCKLIEWPLETTKPCGSECIQYVGPNSEEGCVMMRLSQWSRALSWAQCRAQGKKWFMTLILCFSRWAALPTRYQNMARGTDRLCVHEEVKPYLCGRVSITCPIWAAATVKNPSYLVPAHFCLQLMICSEHQLKQVKLWEHEFFVFKQPEKIAMVDFISKSCLLLHDLIQLLNLASSPCTSVWTSVWTVTGSKHGLIIFLD